MSKNDRTRELEKHIIERQETYDQLPANSTEHELLLEGIEEALYDLAEQTGTNLDDLIPGLERRHMLNITY